MEALVCKLCGGNNLLKEEGYYICQNCGTKYTAEEAKKLFVEGKVDVSGSTVKIDNSEKLENLFVLARRAKEGHDWGKAQDYYEQIALEYPNSWEATFYIPYSVAMNSNFSLSQLISKAQQVEYSLSPTFKLIESTVPDNKKAEIYIQIKKELTILGGAYMQVAFEFWNKTKLQLQEFLPDLKNQYASVLKMWTTFGDLLKENGQDWLALEVYKKIATTIEEASADSAIYDGPVKYSGLSEEEIECIYKKIENMDPSYVRPEIKETKKGGCYVATAVYGSYDCPEVWTLRRFRDYDLAKTWYGRMFIYTYYSISPTIVKWFGDTNWFKRMWKRKLDKMVKKLQNKGFESTPYCDRNW